jgi:hypothetical protein
MGLISGLLTLPLAPVRGTVWIAEKLLEQAEQELDEGTQLRRRLDDLIVSRELGELTEEEFEQAEDDLIARFDELRTPEPKEGMNDAGNG